MRNMHLLFFPSVSLSLSGETRNHGLGQSMWRRSLSKSFLRLAGTILWGDPAPGRTERAHRTMLYNDLRSNPNRTEPPCLVSQVNSQRQESGWIDWNQWAQLVCYLLSGSSLTPCWCQQHRNTHTHKSKTWWSSKSWQSYGPSLLYLCVSCCWDSQQDKPVIVPLSLCFFRAKPHWPE